MNVALLCKVVPAYLPHELLGFRTDSLQGTLLSIDLLTKIGNLESEANKEHNTKRSGRMSKFEDTR